MSNIPDPIVEYVVIHESSAEALTASVQKLVDSPDNWTVVGGHTVSIVHQDEYPIWAQTLVRGFDEDEDYGDESIPAFIDHLINNQKEPSSDII